MNFTKKYIIYREVDVLRSVTKENMYTSGELIIIKATCFIASTAVLLGGLQVLKDRILASRR